MQQKQKMIEEILDNARFYKYEDWGYIKELFPRTYNFIRKKHFGVDNNNHPHNLWFNDSQMYRYFDSIGVYVCPRPAKQKNKFCVDIYNENVCKIIQFTFQNRIEAEVFGFLIAFKYIEDNHAHFKKKYGSF